MGAAFFFAELSRGRCSISILLTQQSLLKRRESIERIQGGHGEKIHLPYFFEQGMGNWQGDIEL